VQALQWRVGVGAVDRQCQGAYPCFTASLGYAAAACLLTPCLHKPPTIRGFCQPASRRAGNLGNLESLAASSPHQQQQQALVETWNSVDPSTLGPRMDSSAALPSLLLLALLIGLGGNRILGLERYFSQFARWLVEQRRYRERSKTIAAREVLERQFKDDGGSSLD